MRNLYYIKFSITAPSDDECEELSRSAAFLFGLIHARYIVTMHGLEIMVDNT